MTLPYHDRIMAVAWPYHGRSAAVASPYHGFIPNSNPTQTLPPLPSDLLHPYSQAQCTPYTLPISLPPSPVHALYSFYILTPKPSARPILFLHPYSQAQCTPYTLSTSLLPSPVHALYILFVPCPLLHPVLPTLYHSVHNDRDYASARRYQHSGYCVPQLNFKLDTNSY